MKSVENVFSQRRLLKNPKGPDKMHKVASKSKRTKHERVA